MTVDVESAVCFTGHRVLPKECREELAEMLRSAILIYIKRGYKCFITGGAVGFDMLASDCLAKLKKEGYSISHILALPCRDQTARWKKLEDLRAYKSMLGTADEVVYTGDFYEKGCMHTRNRYMVDSSSVCIAYVTNEKGGAAYTMKYAQKKGKEVVNLGIISNQLSFC